MEKNKVKVIFFSWSVLIIWLLVILFVFQPIGVMIHEFGHYSIGNFFGCNELSIHLASPFSWEESISGVTGWENCKTPLVMSKDGNRICNAKTNIISSAGLIYSLLLFIPLIIFLNDLIKRKYKKFYLKKSHLVLILIWFFLIAVQSAKYDLFKIGECLVSPNFGTLVLKWIPIFSELFFILTTTIFIIDLLPITKFFKETKSKT